MFSHIHNVTIVTSDQDAALDFYVNTLGFEKVMDVQMGPQMRWLTVTPPGATTQLALGHTSWFEESTSPQMGGRTGISLATSDMDAMYQTLKGRGVKFEGEPEVMPWGDKGVTFSDPDGNEFFVAGP
jgi:catechol 2,3-dioxygenase-like lactoylglutathione lyase family enzyme